MIPLPDGVLLTRKPQGSTSADIVRRVQRLCRPSKVGHTGTLDPMATGLLPLVVGEATKLTRWLSAGEKRYRARVRLGTATDTLDAWGQPTGHREVPPLQRVDVEAVLVGLTGKREQVPPMYSALHHGGRRMYELARAGVEVERKPRPIEIKLLRLLALEPECLDLDVVCSAGTYVRVLAVEISEALGCLGHLEALERTEATGFHLERAVEVEGLDRARVAERILPLEQVLARFERVDVPQGLARRLAQGNRLADRDLARLGVALSDAERIVWFFPPEAAPIVLARLLPTGGAAAMEILRVLRP